MRVPITGNSAKLERDYFDHYSNLIGKSRVKKNNSINPKKRKINGGKRQIGSGKKKPVFRSLQPLTTAKPIEEALSKIEDNIIEGDSEILSDKISGASIGTAKGERLANMKTIIVPREKKSIPKKRGGRKARVAKTGDGKRKRQTKKKTTSTTKRAKPKTNKKRKNVGRKLKNLFGH